MILRRTSGAHICFRCQLRLLKQAPRLISVFLTYTPHKWGIRLQHNKAWEGTLDDSESISPSLEKPVKGSTRRHKVPGLSERQKIGRDTVYRRLPLNNDRLTEHPLGRLHGFRGRKVREQAVGLGLDTLGTESKVIVLRDAGVHFSPRLEIEEFKDGETVDILAQLDAERGLIGQAEVEKNIEELKPKGPLKIITWEELQSIEQQLVNGFTISQLVKYIGSFEDRQRGKDPSHTGKSHKEYPGPVIRKTEWMPGISETGEEFDESVLRGYRAEAFTPKQRLVLQLLRQCWQLEVREVIESIGEVELKIESAELELLIKGSNPVLRSISDKLIASHEEKIEAFRSRRVIRITAPKEKSIVIVREIENVLENIRRLNVDLNVLLPRQEGMKMNKSEAADEIYGNSMIDELSRLTETQISRLPSNQLIISCINRKPETSLSTGADIARRLLLTSSDMSDRNISQIGCSEVAESLVAVRYHATGNMSWHDKLRNWVRLVSAAPLSTPITKEFDITNHRTNDDKKKEARTQADARSSPISLGLFRKGMREADSQSQSHKPYGYVSWERETFTTTSAIVGHILHEVPHSSDVTALSSTISSPRHAKFRPGTVRLSRFLGALKPPSALPKTSLVMRFLPSPWTAAVDKTLTSFPPLEMRFAVHPETKELELKDVIAVVASTSSDVMLPALPLDLRFQQRSTARLRALHGHQLPQITEFLKASQLNITQGRLETPPGLKLPIAMHLCNPTPLDIPSGTLEDCVDCEYLFAGLEYRSTLSLNFEDWSLVYTSIEGGKADGRRGELSLRPYRSNSNIMGTSENSAEWQEKQTQDFIQAAYYLVETLGTFDAAPIRRQKVLTQIGKTFTDKNPRLGRFNYFDKKINFTQETMGGDGRAAGAANQALLDLECTPEQTKEQA